MQVAVGERAAGRSQQPCRQQAQGNVCKMVRACRAQGRVVPQAALAQISGACRSGFANGGSAAWSRAAGAQIRRPARRSQGAPSR